MTGYIDWISSIFTLPYQAISLFSDFETEPSDSPKIKNGGGQRYDSREIYSKTAFRSFTDFTPKNNKLYTYPYSFARITNNSGSIVDYHIEDFQEPDVDDVITDNMTFNVIGIPCEGYSGKARPEYYRGQRYNNDESISMGKYPTLSWSGDSFTNWLSQQGYNPNAENITEFFKPKAIMKMISNATNMISNPVSGIINSTSNMIDSVDSASFQTNKGNNFSSGDINFAFRLLGLNLLHMRPKKEYLQIIDDYFSKYGYKLNVVTSPNIIGRRNWNYVEIASSEEIGFGQAPANSMEVINNACRKGVTIWHNHENLGNYSLDNSIV